MPDGDRTALPFGSADSRSSAAVVPFLAAIAQGGAARPFVSTMPVIAVPVGSSPWSPKPEPTAPVIAAVAAPVIDVEAITAAAREAGRQEGLAETAALRAQLAALVAQVETSRATVVELDAVKIADAAIEVIGAWTQAAPAVELFRPLVASWRAATQAPATVAVNPADVDAMREALGDAAVTIEADSAVSRGDATFRGATLELAQSWQMRLGDLRDVIATALEETTCSRSSARP